MKLTLLAAVLLLSSSFTHSAETLALWTFNSPAPDDSPTSGTLEPAVGSGTLVAIGAATIAFVSGDTTNDPAGTLDNSGLNTSHYPAFEASNRTAGVRFSVDTRGFRDITVSWRQRNSGSASRYSRFQYTADGVTFMDGEVFSADADSIFLSREVGLPEEAADNASFAFQVVSEFEESALGYGTAGYVPTKPDANYSASGTTRFDMVIVSGTRIPDANTPPTISRIGAQTLRVNRASPPIEFTVGDAEDGPVSLSVTTSSSDDSVVPSRLMQLAGQGALRQLTVSAGSIPGTAEVTVSVTDQGGRSASTTFTLLVLPENTSPSISVSGRYSCLSGATVNIPFQVDDLETPAQLQVSAMCANPALVPQSGITVTGQGGDRVLHVTASLGMTGVAPLQIAVSDGSLNASAAVALAVTDSAQVLIDEPFAYSEGSLVTNSAHFWNTRSGKTGETKVEQGRLRLLPGQTEDVVAAFPTGSVPKGSNVVLYAAFKLTARALPRNAPGLLAHFGSGSTLRGRVYAGTTNAGVGKFRLGVANGSTNFVEHPQDLSTNTTYTVVTRYNVDWASTALWVNPVSEEDMCTDAFDAQTAVSTSAYGFRQDPDADGEWLIDDLRVGTDFAIVLTRARPLDLALRYRMEPPNMVIMWDEPQAQLQWSLSPEGPYVPVSGAAREFTVALQGAGMFFRLKAVSNGSEIGRGTSVPGAIRMRE